MLKRMIFKIAICIFCYSVSTQGVSASSGYITAEVDTIYKLTNDSKTYIRMKTTPVDQPTCHTNVNWHFVFDSNSSEGRLIYAGLLAANISAKEILVGGMGSCNLSTGVETLRVLSY